MNFVFSFVLGLTQAHALIIGGVDVTAHDAVQRSTAALYSPSTSGPGGALCTASLIAKNMAVTAAHCVQGGSYAPVMIFGPSVNSPASVQRPVVGTVVNPTWRSRAGRGMDQGDIAVVKFGGGLPTGYKPAVLDQADDVKRGEPAILAGYGVSDARSHAGAGQLRKTTVSVANARRGKSEMIFDQSKGRGACHGDSGGPAYFQRGRRMVLGGVTNRSYPASAADDCAHKVVYTKVAAYRPWIEESEAQLNRGRASTPITGPLSQRLLSHRAPRKARPAKLQKRPRKSRRHPKTLNRRRLTRAAKAKASH